MSFYHQGKWLSARDVITLFGGIRPMAHQLGVAVSTVQGWNERNMIPEARIELILKKARALDVLLEYREFQKENEDHIVLKHKVSEHIIPPPSHTARFFSIKRIFITMIAALGLGVFLLFAVNIPVFQRGLEVPKPLEATKTEYENLEQELKTLEQKFIAQNKLVAELANELHISKQSEPNPHNSLLSHISLLTLMKLNIDNEFLLKRLIHDYETLSEATVFIESLHKKLNYPVKSEAEYVRWFETLHQKHFQAAITKNKTATHQKDNIQQKLKSMITVTKRTDGAQTNLETVSELPVSEAVLFLVRARRFEEALPLIEQNPEIFSGLFQNWCDSFLNKKDLIAFIDTQILSYVDKLTNTP